MLSPPLAEALTRELGKTIVLAVPIGGGCINHGTRVETESGVNYFLKWNEREPPSMFEAEIDGLNALRKASAVRVPEPIACGGGDGVASWLLMEHIAAGRAAPDFDERLGEGLAAIHASVDEPDFGWHRGNWIGSLGQENDAMDTWSDFWRDRRIAPQLVASRRQGLLADSIMDRLIEAIPAALRGIQTPRLVHGDLWSGNVYADELGAPVVIDPAVYLGVGEVDLAMSELFGGFGAGFYEAYERAAGISDEYHAFRRELYQLYFLLVHVNLFGASYVGGCLAAARRVLSAVGA